MSKHIANDAQRKAFDKLVKAFKEAKKSGLVIYAKSEKIVAYTKQADNYIENEHGFEKSLRGQGYQVPNLNANLLADSGADDYGCYMTIEDNHKYNPDNY